MGNLEEVKIFVNGSRMLNSAKAELKSGLKKKNKITKLSIKI